MNVHRATRFGIVLTATLAVPAVVHGQGFGLSEIGTCAVARGFAVTAGGCKDASLIFWNPAATTQLSGWSVLVGAADIAIKGSFERDTIHSKYKTAIPAAIVPHVFINHHAAGSRASWGLGVYVPYGLTTEWGNAFPGNFESQKASLSTIYVQPNVGWQINDRWSVGGGPIVGHSSVELVQAIDLSSQSPSPGVTFAMLGIPERTEFATARLKGGAYGFGAQIGVSGKLTDNVTLGFRALSPIKFKYDNADATFTQVSTGLTLAANNPLGLPAGTPIDAILTPEFTGTGALTNQKVSTQITHPAQVQVGLNYNGIKDWNFEADYVWTGWRSFKELPVNFTNSSLNRTQIEDYNNTSAIRLSAEYLWNNSIRFRGGFVGAAAAAPAETVTPLLPEQDREYANGGIAIPLGSKWTVDAAYSHIFTPGRRGRIDDRLSRATTAAQINSGVYSLSGDVFSISLKASY